MVCGGGVLIPLLACSGTRDPAPSVGAETGLPADADPGSGAPTAGSPGSTCTSCPDPGQRRWNEVALRDYGWCTWCDLRCFYWRSFHFPLSAVNLEFSDLSCSYLSGVVMPHSRLAGANLTGAYLSFADLTGGTAIDAKLKDANLSASRLSSTRLDGADLSGSDLSVADLSGSSPRLHAELREGGMP